jgi:hypothetical protein
MSAFALPHIAVTCSAYKMSVRTAQETRQSAAVYGRCLRAVTGLQATQFRSVTFHLEVGALRSAKFDFICLAVIGS